MIELKNVKPVFLMITLLFLVTGLAIVGHQLFIAQEAENMALISAVALIGIGGFWLFDDLKD